MTSSITQFFVGAVLFVIGVALMVSARYTKTSISAPEIKPGQMWEYLYQGQSPTERSSIHWCNVLEVKDGWVKWRRHYLNGTSSETADTEQNFRISNRLILDKANPFE